MNIYTGILSLLIIGLSIYRIHKLIRLRQLKARLKNKAAFENSYIRQKAPPSANTLREVSDIFFKEQKVVRVPPSVFQVGYNKIEEFWIKPKVLMVGDSIEVTIPNQIDPSKLELNSNFIADLLIKSGHLAKDFLIERAPNPRTLIFKPMPPMTSLQNKEEDVCGD